MIEQWAKAAEWVSSAENKKMLAEVLLSRCYRTGEDVNSDGGGCDCMPHKAYRTSEAEASSEARLKREMQIVAELALTQDQLREVSFRAKAAEDSREQAYRDRDSANFKSSAAVGQTDQAKVEVASLRQEVASLRNQNAEFKDQAAYVKSILGKIDAVKALLK